MTRLDDDLRARLSQSDEEFLADLESGQGFFAQLGATFKGPMGWISIMVMLLALIMVCLAIWFGWEAFQAESAKVATLWVGGAVAAIIGNGLLRIFLMSRMSHLTVMRELKRIELRLIKLDERLV